MIKHSLLATGLFLILASNNTFAKSGPYIGVGIGGEKSTWSARDNITGSNVNFGGTGAVGNLFGGYGEILNQYFYLGAEGFVGLTSTKGSTKKINNTTSSLKQTYNYGASVIPGVMVTKDTLAYARIGVIRSRFEQDNSHDFIPFHGKTLTGHQLGVGVRTAITDKVDFQTEYTYSAYQSLGGSGIGSSIKPNDSQVKIGFVYNFG